MAQQSVIDEVLALRSEVSQLRALLTASATDEVRSRVRVHIDRNNTERKPFTFSLRAPREKRLKLSETRAAITIILLFDLTERSQGRSGITEVKRAVAELLSTLSPELADQHALNEQVRVALYRYGSFWRTEFQEEFQVRYDAKNERLWIEEGSPTFEVEILTSDPAVQDALIRLGGAAMLSRLRQERFIFVPAGGRGGEAFLKEIYSTPGLLQVAGAYVRPSLPSVPPSLVERYASTGEARERSAIIQQRFQHGSLKFLEVVQEDGLRALLRPKDDGTYPYYPGLSRDEALDHVRYIRRLITEVPGYQLVVTRTEIPFYVANYHSEELALTAFFRNAGADREGDYSSFAVWGHEVEKSVQHTLLNWLLLHPSTTANRSRVIEILNEMIAEAESR